MSECRECGVPVERVGDGPFSFTPSHCPECSRRLTDSEERAEQAAMIERALVIAGATPRTLEWSLETYPAEQGGADAVGVAREWIDAYRSGSAPNLYLWGDPGSGKTGLAWGIVRELLRDEYRRSRGSDLPMRNVACLVDVRRYLEERRSAIRGDRRSSDRAGTVPVCVLDDLGAERETEWAVETIGLIVAARYEHLRPTIVTSNYSPDDLSERLGDAAQGGRLLSRLCSGAVVLRLAASDRRFLTRQA